MKSHRTQLTFNIPARVGFENITPQVEQAVRDSGVREGLVLVKSCEIDPKSSVVELAEAGIVDRRFASLTEGAAFPIDFVHHAELARVRALLLGEARPIDD